jgi:hypothetical protein
MGSWLVRKIKVGYWPLSQDCGSPGDRRRVMFWAKARGHEVITDLDQKVDVIIASEKADLNASIFSKSKSPIIFDLIDAYLSPLNVFDDLARGVAKKISGQISGELKPFSRHMKDFCLQADAVICSSVEQERVIKPYNLNTHIILDSHEEIPFIEPVLANRLKPSELRILWEGQPATIRGVRQVSSALAQLSCTNELHLDFVTDQNYKQFLGKFVERNTLTLLHRDTREIHGKISITPWSPSNLVETAKKSTAAMIPIDLTVPMQRLKPENRLLILWRLGLPCLCSPSPAYIRVSDVAGVNSICENEADWYTKFSNLLNNPNLAYEEIARGQNYLHEYHNRNVLLNKWDRVVESVMA